MSLKYSLTFLVLAVACVSSGLSAWNVIGWGSVAFLYVALSFAVLSIAYAGAGPRVLFKRASGRRSFWGWLLLGPYFLLNTVSFGLYRLLPREPAYVQVAPNLFFGRRLTAGEAAMVGWTSVLDLAGEFAEARPL